MKWIYKITYPNKKIYVGKDLTGTISYFGSPNATLIAADFSDKEIQNFTISREILWLSSDAPDREVNRMEVHFIKKLKSNNPSIGYNQWPKHLPTEL